MDNQNSIVKAVLPNTAEDWFIANQREDLSEEECLAFLAWLEEDDANQEAYDQVETISTLMTEAASSSTAPFDLKANDNKNQNALPVFAFAASAAFLLIAVGILLRFSVGGEGFQTSVGEQHTVALEDGSLMRLNTATSINVDFGNSERRVTLNTGEAFFDVQKDVDGRPFLVDAGGVVVRVVGTDFNVYRSADATIVDVLEGLVEVIQKAPMQSAEANTFNVPEGYRISIDASGVASDILPVDADRVSAWLDGRLEFDAAPLSGVVNEFNRYSKTQLLIADESLADLKISGSFTIGRSEEFARGLEEVYPVTLVKEGRRLLLAKQTTADAVGNE